MSSQPSNTQRYVLNQAYIEKKRLQPLWSVGIMTVMMAFLAWSIYQYNGGQWQNQSVLLGILAALLAFNLYRNLKISRNWARLAPSFALSLNEQGLTYHSSEGELNVPMDSVEYIKVTGDDTSVMRIMIKSKTGPKSLIEGFESMKDIADLLKSFVGPEKIK